MPNATSSALAQVLFRLLVCVACFQSCAVAFAQPQPGIDELQAEVARAELVHGADSPALAAALARLGASYEAEGHYAAAEPLYRRSLEIHERALGSADPQVATSLYRLASLLKRQGRYDHVEPLLLRSLGIREASLGPEHPDVASLQNDLASLYQDQGRYGDAERLYRRNLAIWEKSRGLEHEDVSTALNNLASLYQELGRYGEAEPLFVRSLAISEKVFGPEHTHVAISLHSLASLYQDLGRYGDAESLLKRSLAIWQKFLGPEHPHVATSLHGLASLFHDQGRHADAGALYERSLAIREQALGGEHPQVATSLNDLALLYSDQGRHGEAEPLLRRSHAIWERLLGPDHAEVAGSLNNLASILRAQGRHADAEPFVRRGLAVRESVLGPEHPDVASSLHALADVYRAKGQYLDAEPLFERGVAITEKSLGLGHPRVAAMLNDLALLYRSRRRDADALPLVRRASAIYRQRILSASDDNSPLEAATNRAGFHRHLSLLEINPARESRGQVIDESFGIAQLAHATGTGGAVAKMAARFARGDDALASLVRRKQDIIERRRKGENDLVRAASELPDKRDPPSELRLRDELALLSQELVAVDAHLQAGFPQYQVLTRPEPLGVAGVQALLRPGEALILYSFARDSGWSWVVRRGHVAFLPLAIGEKSVAESVGRIRAEMEPDGHSRIAARVDALRLHQLYRSVFAPVATHLGGVKHLIVVPAGQLQSLPFGMLVASPPRRLRTSADLSRVDWLVKRYAISILPSVGSLRALREFAKMGSHQKPFAGFGDPQLTDSPSGARGRNAAPTLSALFRNASIKGPRSTHPDIADVQAIRRAPSLPETAIELRAMAKSLKAGESSLWFRHEATERAVKNLDLSTYRVIAFATHGVMAGELSGVAEPGLILTPPAEGTTEDDGYLSAGEIAQLKLNADWVLLSACNTAAADGTAGAEGLSGLAKSFFYAGSRSLLVSHWPVASEATVLLTTAMLREFQARPGGGKAQAHRLAMLALMNAPGHPEYAHPFYWAPFVLVGEGGLR